MIRNTVFLAVVVAVAAFGLPSNAVPPAPEVPVQGVITDSRGIPLDGYHKIVFSIYESEAGEEDLLWTEQQDVEVVNGLFSTYLGKVMDLSNDIFRDNDQLWLGVQVQGDVEGQRVRLRQTPYSVYSRGDIFPVGTILMYDGSGIVFANERQDKIGSRDGDVDFELYGDWYVCNGQAGTPDLVGRFMRGYTDQNHITGGAEDHRHLTGTFGWETVGNNTGRNMPIIKFYNEGGNLEQYIKGYYKEQHEQYSDVWDHTWYISDNIEQGKPSFTDKVYIADNPDTVDPNLPPFYSAIYIIRMK